MCWCFTMPIFGQFRHLLVIRVSYTSLGVIWKDLRDVRVEVGIGKCMTISTN